MIHVKHFFLLAQSGLRTYNRRSMRDAFCIQPAAPQQNVDERALRWLARRYLIDLHGQEPTQERICTLVAEARQSVTHEKTV